jgi:hypothetical protein
VLVVINLICVGLMAWLGGKFARESGRHALWGLLFVAYCGLAVSVGRDTSEPLADACLLGGLLAYRHSRYVLAALLVAYGVFTNEPILVAACAVIRSSAAPVHEKVALVGFVLVEMVIASGEIWDSVFSDGRTFIEVSLMSVIVLLAIPAAPVADAARTVWPRSLP